MFDANKMLHLLRYLLTYTVKVHCNLQLFDKIEEICRNVANIEALNRKSWVPDRMESFSMTLSDPIPGFKVKSQGHQAALLTAALTRQAAAAVSVGTYWAWENTAALRCARRR